MISLNVHYLGINEAIHASRGDLYKFRELASFYDTGTLIKRW